MFEIKSLCLAFLLTLAPVAALAEAVTEWSSYQEPQEKAFTVDYPKGWKVEGGTGRRTASCVKPWVRTTSVDGSTTMFVGVSNLPAYLLPNQMNPEGKSVTGPAGTTYYKPYETGQQFATDFGRTLLPPEAQDIKLSTSTDDSSERNGNSTITRGTATYSYNQNGKKKVAYFGTQTMMLQNPNGFGNWLPLGMYGFYTTPGNEAKYVEMVQHMRKTNKPAPEFMAGIQKANEEQAQTASAMMQQNNQNFTNWSNMQSQQFNNWSKASFQASQDKLKAVGDRSRAQAQYDADWHKNQMNQHSANMAAKDWNNYNRTLNILDKHLEWDPTIQRNVEVPNY